LANGKSKQNHEISKINWNSDQLTLMSPFLEPYNYYTQMNMDVKRGLPLWAQNFTTMCWREYLDLRKLQWKRNAENYTITSL